MSWQSRTQKLPPFEVVHEWLSHEENVAKLISCLIPPPKIGALTGSMTMVVLEW